MRNMKMIEGINPGVSFAFTFDGQTLSGFEGECIASALMRAGILSQRMSLRRPEPRGYYCGMGSCWECAVCVDGEGVVRSCGYPLRVGLRISAADGGIE
jgi:predicted molibdopterin-dependent oxidoreductase YjgC